MKAIIVLCNEIQRRINALSEKGYKINNVLIDRSGVSISVESGIEKAAMEMGGELKKSPSGMHIGFDVDNAHFGERVFVQDILNE